MCKMIARHVTASLACVKVTSLVFCCHNSDSFFVGLSSLKTLDLDLCRLFMFFSAHMPRLICVSPVINSLSSLLPPYAASPSILPPPPFQSPCSLPVYPAVWSWYQGRIRFWTKEERCTTAAMTITRPTTARLSVVVTWTKLMRL